MLCFEPLPRAAQVSGKQQSLTSSDFPTPPVSELEFAIYKPWPGTEHIFTQHKELLETSKTLLVHSCLHREYIILSDFTQRE